MSVSKWAYSPEKCDGDFCPGDCDYCNKAWEDDDEDDYDPNPVLLHIETDNLDYDVNEEDVSWHWKRLNTYRSATYEELIKAWEREKGYRV